MTAKLALRFHHNVIEHLGLRLYHNRTDKVICELVSNSWDADADRVWIDLEQTAEVIPPYLSITDNGIGMDRDTLQKAFLTVAAPRRSGQNAEAKTKRGRPLMGRKGIGKLAPFGICRSVSVITGNAASGFSWISMDLDEIQKVTPSSDAPEMGSYSPEEIGLELSLADLGKIEHPMATHRDQFIKRLENSGATQGTSIILGRLSDRLQLSSAELKRAIASRFTVTLARPDFSVTVNDEPISEAESLPPFVFKIPAAGWSQDEIGGRTVRFWVGFTGKPLPTSDVGIGVFAHGKLAQERPFAFSLKGNDLYLPYTYGAVQADWLDDFAEDIISTDRASVDWSYPQAALLHEWGAKNLRRWIAQFEGERQSKERQENEATVEADIKSGSLPALTSVERKSLVELLSDVSPRLQPDRDAKSSVASALASAWLHKPAREMLQTLWAKIRDTSAGADNFVKTLEAIREYSVPESLSASVTFAQRAFALTVLYECIHLGKEPDLQALIENFPWIVGPEAEYLVANSSLRRMVLEAEAKGLFVRHEDVVPVKDTIKPDFVFLTDATNQRILVVELKSPQVELTLANREQLGNYLTFLEGKYPGADLTGMLVGNAPHGFKKPREDMILRAWPEIFTVARSAYTKIIASMLSGYADNPDDPRVREVEVFGGDKVWELLRGVSSHDEHLRHLLDDYDKAKVKA